SRTLTEDRSIVGTNIALSAAGAAPDFAVALRGVGVVQGTVFGSDGTTPAAGAQVTVTMSSPFLRDEESTFADNNGRFQVPNVPVGPLSVSAVSQALGGTVSGEILADSQTLR